MRIGDRAPECPQCHKAAVKLVRVNPNYGKAQRNEQGAVTQLVAPITPRLCVRCKRANAKKSAVRVFAKLDAAEIKEFDKLLTRIDEAKKAEERT